MARNKKPQHLKLINGSAKKHPDRHRDAHLIPEPEGELGDAPEHFDGMLVDIWNELVELIPNGVAFSSDRLSLEMLCRIVKELRTADDFVASQYTQFISLCSRFGLTPTDRQNVKIPEKPKKSGFDNV